MADRHHVDNTGVFAVEMIPKRWDNSPLLYGLLWLITLRRVARRERFYDENSESSRRKIYRSLSLLKQGYKKLWWLFFDPEAFLFRTIYLYINEILDVPLNSTALRITSKATNEWFQRWLWPDGGHFDANLGCCLKNMWLKLLFQEPWPFYTKLVHIILRVVSTRNYSISFINITYCSKISKTELWPPRTY